MDFQLNEEQKMLKRMVHELGENEFRAKEKEWEENNQNTSWEYIKKLADLGLLSIALPEAYGAGPAKPGKQQTAAKQPTQQRTVGDVSNKCRDNKLSARVSDASTTVRTEGTAFDRAVLAASVPSL